MNTLHSTRTTERRSRQRPTLPQARWSERPSRSKSSQGNPAYVIKISDETAFFTTSSLTRQIDKWIAAGVEDITGARLAIEKHHIDAKDSRDGKEADYLQFAIMDEEA